MEREYERSYRRMDTERKRKQRRIMILISLTGAVIILVRGLIGMSYGL